MEKLIEFFLNDFAGLVLVRGRYRFRFLRCHFLAAAFQFAGSGLGAESFCAALGTLVSFT
jgi:hypothetical protein